MKKKLAIMSALVILALVGSSCTQNETESSVTTPISTSTASLTTTVTTTPTTTETSTTSPTTATTTTITTTITTTATTTPTTTQATTTTTLSCRARNGEWASRELSTGPFASPILKFTVSNCQITSLTVSVFPLPEEWFLWWLDESLDIQGNKFRYSMTSGGGEFILEGEFTSENTCRGTMKFTSGFFWVDFTLINDVTFNWTAQPSM